MLVLCCGGTRTCKRSTARCCRCCCRRRTTEAPRQIQDQGVARALDPDSELEAEVVRDPCEAVLVGLELQGKPRALAPEGCEDRAASEPTRLLEGDLQLSDLSGRECARLCNHHRHLQLSDVSGRECARLCNHHSQLYMLSCQGRKCSVVSCFCKVHGAHRGTPLCKKQLSETGRALRLPRAQARNLRSPSSNPSVTFFGTGSPSNWYLFLGEVEGISEDSRRTERAVLFVHFLKLRVSLPWHCLGEPPHLVFSAEGAGGPGSVCASSAAGSSGLAMVA